MDHPWSLLKFASRPAYFSEAFRVEPPASALKSQKTWILEKLNGLSFNGPMANQDYFKELLGAMKGEKEGFQSGQPSTAASGQPSTATATASSDFSLIEAMDALFNEATSALNANTEAIRTSLATFIADFKAYYYANTAIYNDADMAAKAAYNDAAADGSTAVASLTADQLTTKWDEYTQARTTLGAAIEAALIAKMTEYNDLRSEYNRFDTAVGSSVVDVSAAPSSTFTEAARPPSPTSTTDNTIVSTYFATGGLLDQLRTLVIGQLNTYVAEYKKRFDALSDQVKSNYPTLSSSLNNITFAPSTGSSSTQVYFNSSTSTDRLIKVMRIFSGTVATTGPSGAPVSVSGALTIADAQVAALLSMQKYKILYDETSMIQPIATGNVISDNTKNINLTTINNLYNNIPNTSNNFISNINNILNATTTAAIDPIKKQYDDGITDLFKIAIEFSNYMVSTYSSVRDTLTTIQDNRTIFGMSTLSSQNMYTAINSDNVATTSTYETGNSTIREIRSRFFMYTTSGYYYILNENLKKDPIGAFISSSELGIASGNQSLPDGVSGVFTDFETISDSNTIGWNINRGRSLIVGAKKGQTAIISKAIQYASEIVSKYNTLRTRATNAGYTVVESEFPVASAPTDFSGAITTYRDYSKNYLDLYNRLKTQFQTNVSSYNKLRDAYVNFVSTVMGASPPSTTPVDTYIAPTPANLIAPAPSTVLSSAPTPASLSVYWNQRDSTTTLMNTLVKDLTTKMDSLGADGSRDTTSVSGKLLPRLIGHVSTEVSDYVDNYLTRYRQLAPSTRTLAPSIAKPADPADLTSPTLTVERLIAIMNSYSTGTQSMFQSVSMDAVLDVMDDYNTIYMENMVINVESILNANTSIANKPLLPPSSSVFNSDINMVITNPSNLSTYLLDYTNARNATYGISMTSLQTIQTLYNNLITTYSTFQGSYSSEFGSFTRATSTAEDTVLSNSTYTPENAATLRRVRNDILIQRLPTLLTEVQNKLTTFYTTLNGYYTAGTITLIDTSLPAAPDTKQYSITKPTFPDDTSNVAAMTAYNNAMTTYNTTGKGLVVSLQTMVTLINSYTTFLATLKSNLKSAVSGAIDKFTALYTDDNKAILLYPGPEPAANIQTTYVLGTSGNNGNAKKDKDSIDTLTYQGLSTMLKNYNDYFISLKAALNELGGKQMKRTEVIGYAQEYYDTLYLRYFNLLPVSYTDVSPAISVKVPSSTTTEGIETLKANFKSTGDSIAFTSTANNIFYNQTADQLDATFKTFAAGTATTSGSPSTAPSPSTASSDVVPRGNAYTELLNDFRKGVETMINYTLSKYTNNLTKLQVRGIPAEFTAIATYTVQDKTTLANTDDKDTIDGLRSKYASLSSILDDSINAGNQSIAKRSAAKTAMQTYYDVLTEFKEVVLRPGNNYLNGTNNELVDKLILYFGESVNFSNATDAFNKLADADLDNLTTQFKGATPVKQDASDPTIYTANYAVGSDTKSLVADIKLALKGAIDRFYLTLSQNYPMWREMPNVMTPVKSGSPTVLPIQLLGMEDLANGTLGKITLSKNKVEAATSDTILNSVIDEFNSAAEGNKGYAILLLEYIPIINTLAAQRTTTQNVLLAYTSLYATFLPVLPTDTDDLTTVKSFLDSRDSNGCSSDFYVLMTGAGSATTLEQFNANRNLTTLASYFGGAGLAALYALIGTGLKNRMDALQTAYGNKDIFNQVMATKGRLGAPSTAMFASAPAVAAKLATDKAAVDTAVSAKNAANLQEIMNAYLGTAPSSYLKYIDTVAGDLELGKTEREETEKALEDYYAIYLPFSATGELLGSTYSNALLRELNGYLTYDRTAESYVLQDAFFNQSNEALNDIETRFKNGASNANGPTDFTLTAPTNEPILQTIRRKLYERISAFKSDFTAVKAQFEQEGVQVSADLNPATALAANGYIATDLAAIPQMSVSTLKEKQDRYAGIIAEFNRIAGPLLETKNLRESIAQNMRAYYDIFLEFKGNILNNGTADADIPDKDVKADLADVERYFNVVDRTNTETETPTFKAIISDNTKTIDQINETLTTIRDKYADGTGPAYTRLIAGLRTATSNRVRGFIQKYKDNQAEIEVEGKLIPERLQRVLPEASGFPALLIAAMGSKTLSDIRLIKTDYYGGSGLEGLFSLIDSTAAGGTTLKTARGSLNSAAETFKTNYNLFSDKLFGGTDGSSKLSQNTNKALVLIDGSAANNQFLFSYTNGIKNLTPYYKGLTASAIDSITSDFNRTYTPALLADIKKALNATIDAFETKYEANEPLFTFVKTYAGFIMPSAVEVRYGARNADRDDISATSSFDRLSDIQNYYIGSSGASYELNTTIDDATLAKTRFQTRQAIVAYYTLYRMFSDNVLPVRFTTSELTSARSYIAFNREGWPSQTAFTSLASSALAQVNTTFTNAATVLLTAIKTALVGVLESFENLRDAYTDFYTKHSNRYTSLERLPQKFNDATVGSDKTTISSVRITELQTIRKKYVPPSFPTETDPILSADQYLLPALIDFVKGQMITVVDNYKTAYDRSTNKNVIGSYTTYTQDKAILDATSPSAADLIRLFGDYDRRTAALNNMSIQFAALDAMHSYLVYYMSVSGILTASFDTSLVQKILRYTTTNEADETYPFTPAFINEITTDVQYRALRDEYIRGLETLKSAVQGSIGSILDIFYTAYQSYEKLPEDGKMTVKNDAALSVLDAGLANISIFYNTYTNRRSDAITFLIYESDLRTLKLIQAFNRSMDLILKNAKYRDCIIKDATAQTQPFYKFSFLKGLF